MREEKKLLLESLKEEIEESNGFVVVRHTGLNAGATDEFRTAVVNGGANFEVVRKRVFIKAAEAAGIEDLSEELLSGSIGVVFAKDEPVQAAKAIVTCEKETKGKVEAVCGRIDGKMVTAQDIETLSKLPSKDEMRAQLLATLVAPMTQTLSTMQALLTSVIYCIDNKVKKESGEE